MARVFAFSAAGRTMARSSHHLEAEMGQGLDERRSWRPARRSYLTDGLVGKRSPKSAVRLDVHPRRAAGRF
jgi:hypothetical protein